MKHTETGQMDGMKDCLYCRKIVYNDNVIFKCQFSVRLGES